MHLEERRAKTSEERHENRPTKPGGETMPRIAGRLSIPYGIDLPYESNATHFKISSAVSTENLQ
jgi:hypothetical protein